ncbi:glycosyltransferase [Arthrobacter oryzae]|uniref:glycosyltransferase n=1 Tax=Arthrobacter oryzae TaxID=409290 RepID=UPI0027D8FF75|nr:glycosyltransferase [Arthrobacter oryzae]
MTGMDITFVANDTRGGVEPYIALAREAASRGHRVGAAAPPDYEDQFVAAGARFTPLRGADREAITAAGGRVSMREMAQLVSLLAQDWARETAELAQGSHMIVSGIGGMGLALPVAASTGAAALRAHLQPLEAPSTAYPGPLAPGLDRWGPIGRRVSHRITAAGTRLLLRMPEQAARNALGIKGSPEVILPEIVYGFSSAVVPVRSDVHTRRLATGYWTLSSNGSAPDASLSAFLDEPGPVVSIGFGSMQTDDPRVLRGIVDEAARLVDVRAVLLTGWGALGGGTDQDERVFSAPSVPHDWLFPRMWANVHHGGAGTTGAAIGAGVPTVIVPFGADQPFWAQRAHRLGIAPKPIPRRKLTAASLAAALEQALSDAHMTARARELGALLGQETGVKSAMDEIESAVERRR